MLYRAIKLNNAKILHFLWFLYYLASSVVRQITFIHFNSIELKLIVFLCNQAQANKNTFFAAKQSSMIQKSHVFCDFCIIELLLQLSKWILFILALFGENHAVLVHLISRLNSAFFAGNLCNFTSFNLFKITCVMCCAKLLKHRDWDYRMIFCRKQITLKLRGSHASSFSFKIKNWEGYFTMTYHFCGPN